MLAKILSYFRVKDWLHILGIPVLGFVYNTNFNLFPMKFFSALLLSSLGLAFAYSFDTNYDKYRSKVKLLPSVIALLAALIYSSFLTFTAFLLTLLGGLIVLAYVLPPFRFKAVPIAVTVSNSIAFSLLLLIGYSVLSNLNANVLFLAAFIAIVAFPVQLVHEISHFSKDKKNSLVTTPVKFGTKFTHFLISVSLVILVIWSFFLYVSANFSMTLAIFAALFSISFLLILRYETKASKSRIYIRYLSIALGGSLLLILLFKI